MIITQLTAQLGVILQKRPELWMSYPQIPRQNADAMLSVAPGGEQRLKDMMNRHVLGSGVSASVAVGDMTLRDLRLVFSLSDDIAGVSVDVGKEQTLRNVYNQIEIPGEAVGASVSVGEEQMLRTILATGTEKSSANVLTAVSIGDTQILSDEV